VAVAARYGIDLSVQRARKIQTADFDAFDLILGLDRDNVAHLNAMQPENSNARVALYLQEALNVKKDVPDPYYGGAKDFETVYRLCAEASTALLQKLITHKD
jgi:protein-tyrosine phosphatase